MTSYTASENPSDTAQTFQITQDQLAHIKSYPVQRKIFRATSPYRRRCLQRFFTTPVFAAVGGPVHEILVTPGQVVHRGQSLLTVTSPDYSAARSAYIKSRDAYALADKLYNRSQDLFAHGAIAQTDLIRPSRIAPRLTLIWNLPPMLSARSA